MKSSNCLMQQKNLEHGPKCIYVLDELIFNHSKVSKLSKMLNPDTSDRKETKSSCNLVHRLTCSPPATRGRHTYFPPLSADTLTALISSYTHRVIDGQGSVVSAVTTGGRSLIPQSRSAVPLLGFAVPGHCGSVLKHKQLEKSSVSDPSVPELWC